jgi:hypothetical protein
VECARKAESLHGQVLTVNWMTQSQQARENGPAQQNCTIKHRTTTATDAVQLQMLSRLLTKKHEAAPGGNKSYSWQIVS